MSDQRDILDEVEEVVFPPLSNESVREAVRLWRHDQAQATAKFYHINKWNTSQVTDMSKLFMNYKEFNDKISEWDVSHVTDMSYMFYGASSFNQDVSEWDVSNVTNMSLMFYGASSFNQDVSEWDVSHVTNMSLMFYGASSFNQDVSEWDVSHVTNMSFMFYGASSFNQDVSKWDVSNVTNMSGMFWGALSFNQDVSEWDVSNVTNMRFMFDKASSFNQDVSMWNISMRGDFAEMFSGTRVRVALARFCDRKSFFDPDCRVLSPRERQEFFSVAFPGVDASLFCCFWYAKDTYVIQVQYLTSTIIRRRLVMCCLMWKTLIVRYAGSCRVCQHIVWCICSILALFSMQRLILKCWSNSA